MNATLEKYLDTVNKCLKPLPTSERVDIVKEIKSSILEMESDNLTTELNISRYEGHRYAFEIHQYTSVIHH